MQRLGLAFGPIIRRGLPAQCLFVIVVKEVPVFLRLLVVVELSAGAALKDEGNNEEEDNAAKDKPDDARPGAEEPREEAGDCAHEVRLSFCMPFKAGTSIYSQSVWRKVARA